MKTVSIREARAHLSRLIERAVNGEPFVIAESGRPLVLVSAIELDERAPAKRLGFLAGRGTVPDDFDTMGRWEIETLFRSPR